MTKRFTLDTNILVDAHDHSDPARQRIAESLIRGASSANCVITLQAVGEFYRAATRKLRATPAQGALLARQFAAMFPLVAPTAASLQSAIDAAEKGRFAIWDAYLLATAAEAGCTICLSSDMHDGAKLNSITVRHTFTGNGLSQAAQALLAP